MGATVAVLPLTARDQRWPKPTPRRVTTSPAVAERRTNVEAPQLEPPGGDGRARGLGGQQVRQPNFKSLPGGTRGVAGAPQMLTHSAASAGFQYPSWLGRGHDESSSTAIVKLASADQATTPGAAWVTARRKRPSGSSGRASILACWTIGWRARIRTWNPLIQSQTRAPFEVPIRAYRQSPGVHSVHGIRSVRMAEW